jgi:hypothetical protein
MRRRRVTLGYPGGERLHAALRVRASATTCRTTIEWTRTGVVIRWRVEREAGVRRPGRRRSVRGGADRLVVERRS